MNFPFFKTWKSTFLLALLAVNAAAGTLYVDLNSTNPISPYVDWSTAATNIQDAVDAAGTGDLVLVNDGVYQTGGRVVYGALTNRVAVTKPFTVQSVNGPDVTIIKGYQVPGITNGDAAIRCMYLTNDAVLSGFTLTKGATRSTGDTLSEQSGGAVFCEASAVVSNCVLAGNSAAYYGGGACSGMLLHCTVTANSALAAGGAYSSALTNSIITGNAVVYGGGGCDLCSLCGCTLQNNSAGLDGGGSWGSTLENCTIQGNTAGGVGGGAYQGVLNNCMIIGNLAPAVNGAGGGTYDASLTNCVLKGNWARNMAGGAKGGILRNCAVTANSANTGGGLYSAAAFNCTVTANTAIGEGGGVFKSQLWNSVIYLNSASVSSNYDSASSLRYCCSPPASGNGNVNADPQLATLSHLSAISPCLTAGNASYAVGSDIDGEPWGNPPSIGCDQFNPGEVTGPLSVSIGGPTNVVAGIMTYFCAWNDGRVSVTRWEFDDGTIVSNRALIYHSWSAPGTYTVVLRGYNDSNPGGIAGTLTVWVGDAPSRFVALGNPTPQPPYSSWASAATNIQDAVDAAFPGEVILVSNGVYEAGSRKFKSAIANRVTVAKPVVLRSANGPGVTIIKGFQVPGATNGVTAIRCVYLSSGARLHGFTLTSGATGDSGFAGLPERSGGGLLCETNGFVVVSNCVFAGNAACSSGGGACYGQYFNCTFMSNAILGGLYDGAGGAVCNGSLAGCTLFGNFGGNGSGGGAYSSTLTNCLLNGNYAASGGGAGSSTLYQCTLAGNSANIGGGACYGALYNCLISSNKVVAQTAAGGGVCYGKLSACTLVGNSSSSKGGGAFGGGLTNCLLVANSSGTNGGGAASAVLINCTLVGNSAAVSGGGTYSATNRNCIIYSNTAPSGPDFSGGDLTYCCTTTLPGSGLGSFTNAPLFVDMAGWDLHLQAISPCINAGLNNYALSSTDLDGNPRISGGTVDVGAYEFQNPASTISYAWLQQFGLPMDGTADGADVDHDGMNNWQEWRAGTDPTNAPSVLQLLSPTNGASGVTVTWQSVTNRNYYLQRSLDLSAQPPFVNVQSNIVGQAGTTSYTDTNAVGAGPFFYRVGVQ